MSAPTVSTAADALDWERFEAARAGDSAAFGLLYERYVDVVFRFILFRLRDRKFAEDLTSVTFLRALDNMGKVTERRTANPGAWFITIARNLILDEVKCSRHRLEVTVGDMFNGLGDYDPAMEATENVYREQLRDDLARCRARLSGKQRAVLAYRFDMDFSVSETAAAMGLNDGAVKALQHRAIRRLGQLLPERSAEGARLG